MAEERTSGFPLGRVAGTPVVLRRSWFVIAVVVAFLLGPTVVDLVPGIGVSAAYLVALGFAGLLLASVFLHEVAHALAARSVGIPPTEIVLDLWGGHTAFDREAPTPGRSVYVAAVGPLTNGLIAVASFGLWRTTSEGSVAYVVTLLLASSNGLVAVLNALPGLPLDGGRVLEGLVWALTRSRTTGTLVAAWAGRLVAVGIVTWFLVLPLLRGQRPGIVTAVWVAAIAWMLWQQASAAVRYAGWQRVAARVSAGRLMAPAVAVPAEATVADAVSAAVAGGATLGRPVTVVVVDGSARPVAVVDEAALRAVPPDRTAWTPVAAVARALPPTVLAADVAGDQLVAALQAAGAAEYAVVDGGRVVGVLSRQAVAAAVAGR